MKRIFSIIVLFALCVFLPACESKEPNILEDENAIDNIMSSVLMLECFDAHDDLYSTGSGFVAFQDNVIVTCYHVIENEVFSITAHGENGDTFQVSNVLVADKDLDLAILELDQSSGLHPLEFADSDSLSKGETIVAIGSPLGIMNSVSDGIISTFLDDDMNTIQFTASISPGSSGGVLFTKAGKVAGVTYASFEEGQNLNLAIPANSVVELWDSKTESDTMTMEDFYDSFIHAITVDEVLANREALSGQEATVRGYISSLEILTYGTGEPQEVRFFLVNSPSEILGATIVIDDWSTATEGDNDVDDYEIWRWKNRECLSIIVDESLSVPPVGVGSEITVQGQVIHFDMNEDCVSLHAHSYA